MLKKDKPITTKPRKFSHSDRNFIAQDVQRLLSGEFVRPSTSPWYALLVVVKDDLKTNKKPMCMAYSKAVNIYTIKK